MKRSIEVEEVQSRICRIRGKQVMLDSDLAALYSVPTFRLNEQVRRNIGRFPIDFMFRLTSAELSSLRSHSAILEPAGRGQHKKYLPYVFTEQGVAMLSGVLRSQRAIDVNIAIMRAFVKLRHAVLSSRDVARRLDKLEGKVQMHETDIRLILEDVRRLEKKSRPDGPISPIIV